MSAKGTALLAIVDTLSVLHPKALDLPATPRKEGFEKMVDIALVTLPFWAHITPNLGPPLLKAYLSQYGYSAKIIDVNIHAYNIRGNKYASKWDLSNGWELSDEAIIEYYNDNLALFNYYVSEIVSLNPKFVGFTTYYTSFSLTKIFASVIKQILPNTKIVFGGPSVAGFMGNNEQTLAYDYVDAICHGEGERAVLYLLQEYDKNGLEGGGTIPGMAYKCGGKLIRGQTENIKKLDDLPFPDFTDYDLQLYSDPTQIPSYVSRGCPNRCNYCTERNFFEGLRVRSANRVLEEFEHIKHVYPKIKFVRFFDSISNAKTSMLEAFCDLKIASGNKLGFNLENAVLRKEMRLPLYRKLKRAGCTLIGYGLETSSQDLLKSVGKLLAIGVDIPKVLSEGKKAGLYISVNVMFGIPDETEEHFQEMVQFLKENRRSIDGVNPAVNFCAYYPGSFVAMDPGKFSIDLSNGPEFWTTKDGSNNYLVRMSRFERFVQVAKRMKMNNLMAIDVLPNKHARLFEYYLAINDPVAAEEEFPKIEPGFLTPNLQRAYKLLKTADCPEPEIDLDEFIGTLKYPGNTSGSFTWIIDNFINSEMSFGSEWEREIHPVKSYIRNLALRIIGFDRIQRRLNGQLLLLKLQAGSR